MKRNNRDKQGFTLAELLVVVAIIAVLVAIAIPIFTSQLEKSREATDAANIRSQYAQVMTDAITDGGNVNGKNVYGAINLNQKKDNWQNTTLGNNLHSLFPEKDQIVGDFPKAGGTAWVEYNASKGYAILHYEGEGSNNGNSSSGDSAGGSGGSSGGTGGETSSSDLNSFINNAIDYGNGGYTGELGRIYIYNGSYYLCTYPNPVPQNSNPADITYTFLPVSSSSTLLKESTTQSGIVRDCKPGDLYYDGTDYYMVLVEASHQDLPNTNNTRVGSHTNGNWVKLIK